MCASIMFISDCSSRSDIMETFVCKPVSYWEVRLSDIRLWIFSISQRRKKRTKHTFPCWHINVLFLFSPALFVFFGVIIKGHVHKKNTMGMNTMVDQR